MSSWMKINRPFRTKTVLSEERDLHNNFVRAASDSDRRASSVVLGEAIGLSGIGNYWKTTMNKTRIEQDLGQRLRYLAKSGPDIPVANATVKSLFHAWARIGEAAHQSSGRDGSEWGTDEICFGGDGLGPVDAENLFAWQRVPDLFVDAVPVEIFLTNAGGPFHQWRMTRRDWLVCFRCEP